MWRGGEHHIQGSGGGGGGGGGGWDAWEGGWGVEKGRGLVGSSHGVSWRELVRAGVLAQGQDATHKEPKEISGNGKKTSEKGSLSCPHEKKLMETSPRATGKYRGKSKHFVSRVFANKKRKSKNSGGPVEKSWGGWEREGGDSHGLKRLGKTWAWGPGEDNTVHARLEREALCALLGRFKLFGGEGRKERF